MVEEQQLDAETFLATVKFDKDGLVPAIVQDSNTGQVLMMAWMNEEAVRRSMKEGKTVFWSRSRQKYWVKGESSGNVQVIKDVSFDCDGDTLLFQVEQTGAACHEGYKSCFFRSAKEDGEVSEITEPRLIDPETMYGKKE